MKDPLQFLFNLPRELERIEAVPPVLELSDFGREGMFRSADPLERSLRRIIDPL